MRTVDCRVVTTLALFAVSVVLVMACASSSSARSQDSGERAANPDPLGVRGLVVQPFGELEWDMNIVEAIEALQEMGAEEVRFVGPKSEDVIRIWEGGDPAGMERGDGLRAFAEHVEREPWRIRSSLASGPGSFEGRFIIHGPIEVWGVSCSFHVEFESVPMMEHFDPESVVEVELPKSGRKVALPHRVKSVSISSGQLPLSETLALAEELPGAWAERFAGLPEAEGWQGDDRMRRTSWRQPTARGRSASVVLPGDEMRIDAGEQEWQVRLHAWERSGGVVARAGVRIATDALGLESTSMHLSYSFERSRLAAYEEAVRTSLNAAVAAAREDAPELPSIGDDL